MLDGATGFRESVERSGVQTRPTTLPGMVACSGDPACEEAHGECAARAVPTQRSAKRFSRFMESFYIECLERSRPFSISAEPTLLEDAEPGGAGPGESSACPTGGSSRSKLVYQERKPRMAGVYYVAVR